MSPTLYTHYMYIMKYTYNIRMLYAVESTDVMFLITICSDYYSVNNYT